MNHKMEEWVQTKLRPKLKKDWLITIALIGALLLVIALPTKQKSKSDEMLQSYGMGNSRELPVSGMGGGEASGGGIKDENALTGWQEGDAEAEYVAQLEEKLKNLLSAMDGVGEVRVMITLEESREYVLGKDEKRLQKQTADLSDTAGERTGKENDWEEETVYRSSANDKTPFVVKQVFPKVSGVVIVARGVGHGCVRSEISEAVQALFGLEAHKVKVLKLGHISSEAGIE